MAAITEKDAQTVEDEAVEAEAVEPEETEEASDVDEVEAEDETDEDDELRLKGKQREKKGRFKLRGRPWGRYLKRSIMPVLLAASLTVSGLLGWQQWQQHRISEAGKQARDAAIAYAGVLTSIDSNNLNQNFQQVLDGSTGEFKDQYTQSSVQLRQLLIDNKATAHGTVVDSAITSESLDKVTVLLFIDQTVSNKAVPDPRIDRSRIKMTMEKVDGRWRAAKVQLL